MLRKKLGRIEWLEFEQLAGIKGVKHGVFLRGGGVSKAPYDSLNLSKNVGDLPESVQANRHGVQQVIGCDELMYGKQCHGSTVLVVPSVNGEIECDGLITEQKGVGLLITHADCQAVILYDPIKHVAANVHAGWKGNVCNIFAEAVLRLQKEYGVKAADLIACVSPSLGPCCAEFVNYRSEFPKEFWRFEVGKNDFDLWQITRWQLEQLGIEKIEVAGICTRCRSEDFFSYRRDKVTGRNGTVISINDRC